MTFEEILDDTIRNANLPVPKHGPADCRSVDGRQCTLCRAFSLGYDDEVRLRQMAFDAFRRHHVPELDTEPLVRSPLGRGYRTVTKRKVLRRWKGYDIGLIVPAAERGLLPVQHCLIEPDVHGTIFRLVQEKIMKPYASRLAEALQYVIIKGNYEEQSVILSVTDFSPALMKAANTLSKSLTHEVPSIVGIFLFLDTAGSKYYLGTGGKSSGGFHKVHGKPEIFVRVGQQTFLYHPLAFSQVNLSIMEALVGTVGSMLPAESPGTLYDLYCGYGLFSLSFARQFASVCGVEFSLQSVDAAKANALRRRAANVRFIRTDIKAETVLRTLRSCSAKDAVILDPPRNGVSAGVVDAIASLAPGRVIHIFCNIDLLPDTLKNWRANGYEVERVVPLDQFPGTADVETVVSLRKEKGRTT